MHRLWVMLLVLAAVVHPLVSSPENKKPLTNADVINLVKAGLPEKTVILAIEQSPTKFETSPAALIELKNQGVPQGVMEAMLRSSSETAAPPLSAGETVPKTETTAHLGTRTADGIDTALLGEGTYYKSPTGWVKLQQLTMAGGGAVHVGKMLVPGLTPQIVWTYRGAEAPVQIAEQKPTFVVKQSPYLVNVPGHSDRDLVIVRFNKKKDHRELQTTSGGNVLTFKAGFTKEKMPDITVTRISETSFSVTPVAELPPGEYLLTFGAGGYQGFDFGVKSDK